MHSGTFRHIEGMKTFFNRSRSARELKRLTEVTEIIFYEMPKLKQKVRDILAGTMEMGSLSEDEKWCMYMKYRHEESAAELIAQLYRQEEGIMRAERAVEGISRDYLKAIRKMNIIKNEMDRAQRIWDMKEEGRTEGLAEGRTEGRTEGLEEAKREIARKLKSKRLPIAEIVDITGLSFETIEQM